MDTQRDTRLTTRDSVASTLVSQLAESKWCRSRDSNPDELKLRWDEKVDLRRGVSA